MLFFTTLVLIFAAVFGFIAWRIFVNASGGINASGDASRADETYICPVCNEQNCYCETRNTSGKGSD